MGHFISSDDLEDGDSDLETAGHLTGHVRSDVETAGHHRVGVRPPRPAARGRHPPCTGATRGNRDLHRDAARDVSSEPSLGPDTSPVVLPTTEEAAMFPGLLHIGCVDRSVHVLVSALHQLGSCRSTARDAPSVKQTSTCVHYLFAPVEERYHRASERAKPKIKPNVCCSCCRKRQCSIC